MDLRELEKFPLFTAKDLKAYFKLSNPYTYLLRWERAGQIKKMEKGKYTLHEDSLIYATQIVNPSYLSFFSALSYYGFTSQMPLKITVAVKSYKKPLNDIEFIEINKNYFFGFVKEKYKNFDLFIADKEKLLLDCLLYQNQGVQISELGNLLNSGIDKEKIINYLFQIDNVSLIKRCGFLLEKFSINIYDSFEKKIKEDKNYILLNKNLPKSNNNSSKWKININEGLKI